MSSLTQAIVTIAANVGGYALGLGVLIWLFRHGNPTVARIGTALWVLFIFWVIVLAWYVGTEFWIDAKWPNGHGQPAWLEASNGIAENNQSEIFQVWLATLLYKHLRVPGSPEDKEFSS